MGNNTEKESSAESAEKLAGIKELEKEIQDFNKFTKDTAEKLRTYIPNRRKQDYVNCKEYCTGYARDNGLELPLCTNSGESFESDCHVGCEKLFVTTLMKTEFIGKCDDSRKYPAKEDSESYLNEEAKKYKKAQDSQIL